MKPQSDKVLLGVILMTCFAMTGPVIDTFAKLAAAAIPVAQIAVTRFFVQAALLTPIAALRGHLHRPSWREMALHLIRGALIVVATSLFFGAIKFMPIADAISIFFVEPFILILLGAVLLGESVGWRRIVACSVGFGGALLVIKPSFAAFGLVATLPLGTALTFAFYMILTRQMVRQMHPLALQSYTAVACLVICVPVLILADGSGIGPLDPVWPTPVFAGWLLGVGVAATIAHVFLSFALRFAPAATIAPLQYLEIVAATILGYLVFSDFPDRLTLVGVAIIISSGLYVFYRERQISAETNARPLQDAP